MSFKTLRKRIALVAVAALGTGIISAVPQASAAIPGAANLLSCSVALNTTTCTQSVGNRVILRAKAMVENQLGDGDNDSYEVANASANEYFENTTYYISVTGSAKLDSVTDLGTDAETTWGGYTGATDEDGFGTFAPEADISNGDAITAADGAVTIVGTGVGTATVTIFYYDGTTGVKTTVESVDVNFVAAATVGVSSTNTIFATYDNTTDVCDTTATSPVITAALATKPKATADTASGIADLGICFVAFDGTGAQIATTSYITVTAGTLAGAGTFTRTVNDGNDGIYEGVIRGDGLYSGPATASVTAVDAYGNVYNKTLNITFYGVLNKLTATSVQGAGAYGSATFNGGTTPANAFADFDTDQQAVLVAALSATDAKGNAIRLDDVNNSVTTANLAVISSAVPGTTLTRGVLSTNGAVVTVGVSDVNLVYGIHVDCSASASAEKLTIRAFGLDTTPTPDVYVAANDITYYCSDATKTLTVSASAASAESGSSLTAQINAVDANGFPIPDGTAVSIVAANGAGISTPSTITNSGKLAKAANVLIGSSGPVTISATVGGVTASTKVAVTGAGNIETQITALVAAIAKLQKAITKIQKRLK